MALDNVVQPVRRRLIELGASFRRAELKDVDFEAKVVIAEGGKEFPYDHLISWRWAASRTSSASPG